MANWVKRSIRRASLGSRIFSGAQSFTWPVILAEKSVVSNRSRWQIPFLPSRTAFQNSLTLLPSGLMVPMPVTTTRRVISTP